MSESDSSTTTLGIGVIGARSIVAEAAVLPAISASDQLRLVATASLGGPVKAPWDAVAVSSYEEVIDHPEVDLVYIPLPNGLHAEWAERCARAGKTVLCEKPLARTGNEAEAMAAVAERFGTRLVEAWMTPYDARWSEAIDIARRGDLGTLERIDTAFTFTLGPEAEGGYRWDPQQGGGALLDLGIYCLGPAVALWGVEPDSIDATATFADSGVDITTTATLTWERGRSATIRCSFLESEQQTLIIKGSTGTLSIEAKAHTGGAEPAEFSISEPNGQSVVARTRPADPYLTMLETLAYSLNGGREWSRPVKRSIEMMKLIDRISAVAKE